MAEHERRGASETIQQDSSKGEFMAPLLGKHVRTTPKEVYMTMCPDLVFHSCDTHHDQNQLARERVYLGYTSTPQSTTEGSQGRNSSRRRGRKQEE